MIPSPGQLNWFDMATACIVILGIIVGKKRGISEELLDFLQWLAIVFVAGAFYRTVGAVVGGWVNASEIVACMLGYAIVAIAVILVFSGIKKAVGQKILESHYFGGLEYYLGMLAGAVRFLCMWIVVLAFLNARYYTESERAAQAKLQADNFGTITFPTIASLQQTVFFESHSGRFLKERFDKELIETSPTSKLGAPKAYKNRVNDAVDETFKR